MADNINRVLQLHRSTTIYNTFDAAMEKIAEIASTRKDGEIDLIRYLNGNEVSTAIAAFYKNGNTTDYTVFKDGERFSEIIATITGGPDAEYAVPAGTPIIENAPSVRDALVELAGAVGSLQSGTIAGIDSSDTIYASEMSPENRVRLEVKISETYNTLLKWKNDGLYVSGVIDCGSYDDLPQTSDTGGVVVVNPPVIDGPEVDDQPENPNG